MDWKNRREQSSRLSRHVGKIKVIAKRLVSVPPSYIISAAAVLLAILTVFSASISVTSYLRARIIVHPISLPSSLIEKGYSEDKITYSSISFLPAAAAEMIEDAENYAFGGVDQDGACRFVSPSAELAKTAATFREGVAYSAKNLSSYKLSENLNALWLADWASKFFDQDKVHIFPAAIELEDGSFSLQFDMMKNSGAQVRVRSSSLLKNISDVKFELEKFLVLSGAPDFYAFVVPPRTKEDLDELSKIPAFVTDDRYRDYYLAVGKLNYSLISNLSHALAETHLIYEIAPAANEVKAVMQKLDIENPSLQIGVLLLQARAFMSLTSPGYSTAVERLTDADEALASAMQERKEELLSELSESEANENNALSYRVQATFARVLLSTGDVQEAAVAAIRLLKEIDTQDSPSAEFALVLAAELAGVGLHKEAEELLSISAEIENPWYVMTREDLHYWRRLVRGYVLMKINDVDLSHLVLGDEEFVNYPCYSLDFLSWLNLLPDNHPFRSDVSRLEIGYRRLEGAGVRNFTIYNSWGTLLSNAGRHSEAIEMYQQASHYEGDQAWSLLNEGNSLAALGKFEMAADRYQESLEVGAVPSAMLGLFNSYLKNNDIDSLYKAFSRYGKLFPDFDDMVKDQIVTSAISACEVGRDLSVWDSIFSEIGVKFNGSECEVLLLQNE